MDLEVLCGSGHCIRDIPNILSVDVSCEIASSQSNMLTLGYTVLGRSHEPFVFRDDIAERPVIASPDRPRR